MSEIKITSKLEPKLSNNAIKVLDKLNYLRGETPRQMFERIAIAVAKAELLYQPKDVTIPDGRILAIADSFYELIASLDFLPNSPTIANAGRELGQLAGCFVLPIEDNMSGIFTTLHNAAMVQKSGGGTGFHFGGLRPKGTLVSSTVGEASGPISFMRVFNGAAEEIRQGGIRRGANMGMMIVNHPDIMEFINAKADLTQLTNFNMSVAITDEFMEALANGEDIDLVFKGQVYTRWPAKVIFDNIVVRAWTTGEPGVVFIDEINKYNPTPGVGTIESTNPCGEQPLLPYEACNLGSINLLNHVDRKSKKLRIDRLEATTRKAVRFLDDVIDVNNYPLPEIEKMAKGNRKIGLGVMGWADTLLALGIPYDSEKALDVAGMVMSTIQNVAYDESVAIAKEKGNFPNIHLSIYTGAHMRNAARTTIAPTGTLSIVAGVSSGIEALFALSYTKNLTDGGSITVLSDLLVDELNAHGYPEDVKQVILAHVIKYGTLAQCALIDEDIQRVFKTTLEISPEWQVRMQAAFQKHTDNAVSKTINFNDSVTEEEIANAIKLAYQLKCKGLTVYRNGSRETQPLQVGQQKEGKRHEAGSGVIDATATKRPKRLPGFSEQVSTGCGKMYVTVNYKDGKIFEVFLKTGGFGGCAAFTEALGRVISIGLRYGVPLDEQIKQVTSVICPHFTRQAARNPLVKGKSCPDVVGDILRDIEAELKHSGGRPDEVIVYNDEGPFMSIQGSKVTHFDKCPECGKPIEHEGGCIVCRSCGYGKC